jgi:hypothetical protein
MALGKILIDQTSRGGYEISWKQLSQRFLDAYLERIKKTGMPQQATSGRLTKMERIVSQLNVEKITYDQAIDLVATEGFNDVVPRFQTIGTDKTLVGNTFYDIEFGKRLIIKDALLEISTNKPTEYLDEIDARWGLLEGAFSINQSAESLTPSKRYKRDIPTLRGGEANKSHHQHSFSERLPRQYLFLLRRRNSRHAAC